MSLKIGKNDTFERIYMGKFLAIASRFGEFVKYERDRAARDIGLHFTSSKSGGGEVVAPSLVWFQMKGIQEGTLSKENFESADSISINIQLNHLQFWYIAPEPTYLVIYVEAVSEFFVTNIKEYISDKYGDAILSNQQVHLTVYISKDSILDDQAFSLISKKRNVDAWRSKIADGDQHAEVFFRDANIIMRIRDAYQKGKSVQIIFVRYGSKMRSEVYFFTKDEDDTQCLKKIHSHWEYAMPDDLSISYPYLDFKKIDLSEDKEDFDDNEWPEIPSLFLPNGDEIKAEGAFERYEYDINVQLNDIGEAWAETLTIMEKAGFIEVDLTKSTGISVAPWHARDV